MDRPKINIRPFQRYVEPDLVAHALGMAEDIHCSECCVDLVDIPNSVDLISILQVD